ncbi:flavoprotein [Arthrobacter sp. Z1-15]
MPEEALGTQASTQTNQSDSQDSSPSNISKLLVVVTGTLEATFMPYWLVWIRQNAPELQVQVRLTASASKFVSLGSINALTGNTAQMDTWGPLLATGSPRHIEDAIWADAVIVYPASIDYIGRFAAGLGDSPSLLTLQCTNAPIGIAPTLPPGASTSKTVLQNIRRLENDMNVSIATSEPTWSATTGQMDASTPGATAIPDLLANLNVRYQAAQGGRK